MPPSFPSWKSRIGRIWSWPCTHFGKCHSVPKRSIPKLTPIPKKSDNPFRNSTTDRIFSNGWQILEEKVGANYKNRYVWSPSYIDALVSRDRDTDANGTLDERLFAQHDANFNVTAITNTSGTVQERYTPDPFGVVTFRDASGNTISASAKDWVFLHQGGQADILRHYDFRNRILSPTLGRWLTNDPLGFDAGDNNFYRYVANGSGNGLDPSGLDRYVIGGACSGIPFQHSRIAVDIWKYVDGKWVHNGYKTFEIGNLNNRCFGFDPIDNRNEMLAVFGVWACKMCVNKYDYYNVFPPTENDPQKEQRLPSCTIKSTPEQDKLLLDELMKAYGDGNNWQWYWGPVFNCHYFVNSYKYCGTTPPPKPKEYPTLGGPMRPGQPNSEIQPRPIKKPRYGRSNDHLGG